MSANQDVLLAAARAFFGREPRGEDEVEAALKSITEACELLHPTFFAGEFKLTAAGRAALGLEPEPEVPADNNNNDNDNDNDDNDNNEDDKDDDDDNLPPPPPPTTGPASASAAATMPARGDFGTWRQFHDAFIRYADQHPDNVQVQNRRAVVEQSRGFREKRREQSKASRKEKKKQQRQQDSLDKKAKYDAKKAAKK